MHKARSSQLLPLPADTEVALEASSVVQVQTSSKEQYLLVNDSGKKYCNIFLQSQLAIS
jgi:hypothetical protein